MENDKIRRKDRFSIYYNHIKKNYEFDTEDLVACFLDKDVFQRFTALDATIIQDAKSVQKIVHFLPELQAATEAAERIIRVSDLFENNRTFLSEKFDYYEWLDKDKIVGDVHDMDDMLRIQQHDNQHMRKEQETLLKQKQLEVALMELMVSKGFVEGELPNGHRLVLNLDLEKIE